MLMLHRTRELLIKQKTIDASTRCEAISRSSRRRAYRAFRKKPGASAAREAAKVLAGQIADLDKSRNALEADIAAAHEASEMSRLLVEVPGIGKLIATAIVASLPDPGVCERGRAFSAWLGLVPRQNSTGGKRTLGAITKQGNRYIRKRLVLAATSLPHAVGKRKGALRDWIVALLARKPARLVTVAGANKLARILWAMMTTGESFRAAASAKA